MKNIGISGESYIVSWFQHPSAKFLFLHKAMVCDINTMFTDVWEHLFWNILPHRLGFIPVSCVLL